MEYVVLYEVSVDVLKIQMIVSVYSRPLNVSKFSGEQRLRENLEQ